MKKLDKARLENNIREVAKYDLENNNVFASSYFVYQNGDTVFEQHFGFCDLEKTKPVNSDTIYRLASMTKPITAVGILTLVDEGLISLNDAVSKYIPDFNKIHIITTDMKDLGVSDTEVTILHLLTHTSGIGSIKPVNMTREEMQTIDGTVKYFAKQGLDFEPFTNQAYSAYAAFDVLVKIIQKITSQTYEDFLKKRIFVPCNMKDTTFMPTTEQWDRIITMHDKKDGSNIVGITYEDCVFQEFPAKHMLAGAGLVSTLSDYANFAKMLLKNGTTEDGTMVVSEKNLSMLAKPYVPQNIMSSNVSWGLGVRVITEETYKDLPVGAFGWSGAYGSHFWVDPENKLCAVFMKNSRFDGGAGNKSARRFEMAVHNALI